jgi:hypothetical protein
VGILIVPGLATLAIGEVRIGTAYCEVQNQVEFSVEGGGIVFTYPRIVEALGELATLEEALLGEINLEYLVAVSINVGVEFILVPVKSINVEVFAK